MASYAEGTLQDRIQSPFDVLVCDKNPQIVAKLQNLQVTNSLLVCTLVSHVPNSHLLSCRHYDKFQASLKSVRLRLKVWAVSCFVMKGPHHAQHVINCLRGHPQRRPEPGAVMGDVTAPRPPNVESMTENMNEKKRVSVL